jgi:predicted DNA-binding transcriptional regulator AlpA
MHQHQHQHQLEYPAPERLLRLSEVLFLTGLPRSTLYYQIQKGRFPRPQKRGRISLWRFSEVERYISDPNRYTPSLYQK